MKVFFKLYFRNLNIENLFTFFVHCLCNTYLLKIEFKKYFKAHSECFVFQ